MLKHYINLMRVEEWLPSFSFVLAGAFFSHAVEIAPLFILFVSFFFLSCAGFIINDVFDYKFDRLKEKNRNPISKGYIKRKYVIMIFTVFVVLGLIPLFFLPVITSLLFISTVALMFAYSIPPFRLKERYVFDIVIHALPGFTFPLIGYLLFSVFDIKIFFICLTLFIINAIAGIAQEIRDYNADKKSGFMTTVGKLGIKNSISSIKLLFILCIFTVFGFIYSYLPIYFFIIMLSMIPYSKFLFFDTYTRKDFFDKGIKASVKSFMIVIVTTAFISLFWFGII